MNPNELTGLINDTKIDTHVAVENLILIHLGLRPCSQTTIPAELPNGSSMGEEIDANFKPRLDRLKGIQDQKTKIREIAEIRKGMASAFDEIVEGSQEYKALMKWVKKLGLRTDQVEVRPTLHEIYLYREKNTLKALQRLMQERGRLRIEAVKKHDPLRGHLQFAYPEEFNGTWIRRMGALLDYPDCCVERYASDREKGVNAEERATSQLKELSTVPDPYVYLASHFLPCSPTCKKAKEKGELYHQKLTEALPQAGEAYTTIISENMDRVRRQPEIIGNYLTKLRGL